ncbi:MAG: serine/threonine protein kinase [Planctomycetes bacterium]|nr:serine/threonine protein kinase [Planctomycetota bacterium]
MSDHGKRRPTTGSQNQPPAGDGLPTVRPSFIARFPVLSELGRGRNSIVYHAIDPKDKTAIAVKVVYSVDEKRDLKSLEHAVKEEAELLRVLNHPNIVPVKEAGIDEGHAYLVFPFIQGITFEKALPAGMLALNHALACMIKIALAVQHAHDMGLIHRDLKPGNIILGNDGEPHVLDFGLSWRRGSKSKEGVQSIVGTPSYMSPEQARGEEEKLTPATDVYSLGAILYEVLVARPPFQADTPWRTLQLAMQQPPVPPRQIDPTIDENLERLALWCLEKSAEDRYRSAEHLAQDLQRAKDGQPLKGPRKSIFHRKLF